MDSPSQPKVRKPSSGSAQRGAQVALRIAASAGFVAASTLLFSRVIHVNAATVGFLYLVVILVIATTWGLWEATIASILAMLGFNYFFLPPLGTFTIADPQNWVALLAFLATSFTASQLSDRAKRRTREAIDRRQEMERLYALSRAILLTEMTQPIAKQIAHQIAHTFGLPAVILYDRINGEIHRAGPEDLPGFDGQLREVAVQGTFLQDDARQVVVTAIRLGSEPIASIALQGASFSDTALQALSNLVAIGLEKIRGQEAANRAEAARQSEELKSTLLDAIAHEFKTPLTSIKAAATSILANPGSLAPEQQELVTIVDEEADRLSRLVTEAIQMARIESGKLQLNLGLHSASSLIQTALQQMKSRTDSREIRMRIEGGLRYVNVDGELIQLAIRQLLDNALKYSPPIGLITVSAREAGNTLIIGVTNEGAGIPEAEQSRVFQKFYRGPKDRPQVTGTGMGLTIAREILQAHGGDVLLKSAPGEGAEFQMSIPVAAEHNGLEIGGEEP